MVLRTQEVLVSTTVLLVDDHELIRQGLRRAFERSADFEVVGSELPETRHDPAPDGREHPLLFE